MKRLALCSFTLLAAVALLEAQLSVPVLGVARFSDGSVHPVRGVAANFIVDSHIIATAQTASFSDVAGLLASDGLIRLLKPDGTLLGQYQSAEPQPVLNINAGTPLAAAWLPSKHLLLQWNGSVFTPTPIDDTSFGGRVTSLSLTSKNAAQFFITETDSSMTRISVSLPTGRVTSINTDPAGARSWLISLQGWTLSQDPHGILAEQANGLRQTIQLSQQLLPPDDLTLEQMADHWLHVSSRSAGTDWAIYLDPARLTTSRLPPPVTEASK